MSNEEKNISNNESSNKVKTILIATAFPTQGAGSGALISSQAKAYVEAGYKVIILTANNRTDYERIPGVTYVTVPFTGETENPEKIKGQLPFNYLMFTTHTESTANFWNVSLEELEQYCKAFKTALHDTVEKFHPEVLHAQHNWLLSSEAGRMNIPIVTTIHGTDLMGYERAKEELAEVMENIEQIKKSGEITSADIGRIQEIYLRSASCDELRREIENLSSSQNVKVKKEMMKKLTSLFDAKRKYEFYISESEHSARESEKIIVISKEQKEKFNRLFPYAKDKVELVENGYDKKVFCQEEVDREEVISSLTSDRTPDGKISTDYDKLVLFVGKFADFKGMDSMLTAIKQVEEQAEQEGQKVLTLIVGSGALEKKLKDQATQLELKNTHFVGRQPHSLIRKLQNLANVSLIPSRNEPFGLVVIEGTACGHPVIASNAGGIPDILNTTGEELPNEDIIKTKLGVLIRPLPDRPKKLSEEKREELDRETTKYVIGNEETREEIVNYLSSKLGLSSEEISKYLEEYTRSTNALASATMKTLNGEFSFDNDEIARHTRENYSLDVIMKKLIGVFESAVDKFKKRVQCK